MLQMPHAVLTALQLLTQKSFEAFVVGGCVRDFLLEKQPHDWDITTNAKPDDCIAIFKDYKVTTVGAKFGTITVYIENLPIEITTYRTNEIYINGRKPEKITFANTLKEDLSRRDFTMNALAYHPKFGLIDYYNGISDLKNRCIRAIGNPKKRFEEDHLRILRAIRFASTLGFVIEPQTLLDAKAHSHTILSLSPERIASELSKIILAENPNISLLEETVLPFIIPTLCTTPSTPNKLTLAPPILTIRLAILLHTLPTNTVRDTLLHLRYPNQIIDTVTWLVSHQYTNISTDDYAVRNAYHHFGERFSDWLLFQNACNPNHTALLQIGEQLSFIKENKIPIFQKDLAINGNDLKLQNIAPTQIGQFLNACMQRVLKDPTQNTKEQLLYFLKSQLEK